MSHNTNITSRVLTGATVVALVFALSVSGALAGFFRTLDGLTANGIPNPAEFLFGFGSDGTEFGYGYGYGYGNGDFEAGFPVEEEVVVPVGQQGGGTGGGGSSSSGGGGGGGGGGGSSSSSSSGGGSGSSSGTGVDTGNTDTDTNTDTDNDTTEDTNPSTPGGSTGSEFRDFSDQPRLATCGTSIVNFTDISGNTFEDFIIRLEARSGLNGNGNGSTFNIFTPAGKEFQPLRTATRSEYVKMILRALCIDYSGENSTLDDFNDAAVDVWQAKVVNKAAELGLINTANDTFRVNATITRAEALKMVMRAGLNSAFTDLPETSSFSDVAVGSWQSKYTQEALTRGYIAANPTFRPANPITRGESAKFILNALRIN